jgi:transcriptional regulator with XRE-family HTH domain
MSLFFDAQWFDAHLRAAGLSRSDVATALGLSASQIEDLWKDQRELGAQDVRILAALIGAPPAEVAAHAGISTPVPREQRSDAAFLAERMERMEKLLIEIRDLVRKLATPT